VSFEVPTSGPLAGEQAPIHGGNPNPSGCGGCVDCCHLPEISVTDEEAATLRTLHARLDGAAGPLDIRPRSGHDGWQTMHGPCSFRQEQQPLAQGGCRIYEDRPGTCRVFVCQFLRDLRFSVKQP
jgi:Fe-S-cluster containining protein